MLRGLGRLENSQSCKLPKQYLSGPQQNNNATQPAFSIGPSSTVIPDGQMSASFVYYVGNGPLEKILIRAWPEYAYFSHDCKCNSFCNGAS